MSKVAFTIYGPPVAKGRPRHMRNGHTFTPAKTRQAEDNIRAQACRYLELLPGGDPIPAGVPIQLTILFCLPIPASWSLKKQRRAEENAILPTTKPDLDNLVKAVKDALNGLFWHDDSQVVRYGELTGKYYDRQPKTEVIIETLEG